MHFFVVRVIRISFAGKANNLLKNCFVSKYLEQEDSVLNLLLIMLLRDEAAFAPQSPHGEKSPEKFVGLFSPFFSVAPSKTVCKHFLTGTMSSVEIVSSAYMPSKDLCFVKRSTSALETLCVFEQLHEFKTIFSGP